MRFNEAMYINGPLQTLFLSRHVQLKLFTPEIWLLKGLHMLSMGNPVISRWSAILNREFKMRLCASVGYRRHCSCIGIMQVRSFSTEIWLRKRTPCLRPKSALGRPYWTGPIFYLTCIKVVAQVITCVNMNEIHSCMSEIWLRKGKVYDGRQTDRRTTDGRQTPRHDNSSQVS